MILIGLDPGFASLGYCTLHVTTSPGNMHARNRVVEFGVISTEKDSKKRHTFSVEDNLRRLFEISKLLRQLVARSPNCVAICAEAMSFPRSSAVAAKMAMAWGAIGSLSEVTRIPILQVSPMLVKKAVTGIKTATKKEVQDAVAKLYPEVIEKRDAIKPKKLWEHCHDAVAVAHAMLDSDLVKIVQRAG